jgi:hypothetical protein
VLRFQSYSAVSALRLIAHHATFVAIWALGIVLAASVANATQLTLSWADSVERCGRLPHRYHEAWHGHDAWCKAPLHPKPGD